jgi:hypothetical protein
MAVSLALALLLAQSPAPAQTPPAYPLKPSANGRYLADQLNAPFLLLGDSPQALIVNLSETDADTFFADRSIYGINTVWINLLCASYTGGRPDASTIDGLLPFTGLIPFSSSYDLATTNEPYFAHVDRILTLAAEHGIQVLLDPAETGSFLSVMLDNGPDKCRAYGQFLGRRYRDQPNIIWMSGNDFQTWRNPGDDAVVRSVALGIRDFDTNHLQTTELDYVVSSSLDDANWAPLLGLNGTYTYYPTYARLLQDYNRTNFLPNFLVEANYEFENLQGPITTPPILRKQEYWAMTSGACGQLYGNHYTWPFADGWQANLDTPGAEQFVYLKTFFEARAWFALVPDTNHTVVTAGYGTFSDVGHVADNDYLTAASVPDGSLAVVYTPIVRQFTVDLSKLSGPAVTRWFDPASAIFTLIPGSPFPNSGLRTFTPPGPNTDGDGGWVLVLETNPPPDPPPPPLRPRFVQQVYATPQTQQTQASVAFPAAQSAGNANLLAIGWNDTSAAITAVTDSVGNLYLPALPAFRGNGLSQALYYALNINPGTNSVRVLFNQAATFIDLRALEYSGLARSNALDNAASATGLGTTAACGPINVSASNELLFAAGMTATTFTSAGSGFTTRLITTPDADLIADRLAPAPGSYNATAALSSGAWLMQLAAFKPLNSPFARPLLRIQLASANTALIAWPAAATGFVLQQTSSLTAANWSNATNPVTVVGAEYQATLSLTDSNQFYRLSHP